MTLVLTAEEIKKLRICGRILSSAFTEVQNAVKPGINGYTLDKIAEKAIRRQGARPSFLNYGESANPFPASLCLSINNEVVHGIPAKDKIIREGDIVSLDLGAEYEGIFTDMAKSIIAGKPKSPKDVRLLKITLESLNIGINAALGYSHTGDIGHKIQSFVESNGYNVVKALVGHGIGREAHQDPQIPNFGSTNEGPELIPGMAIAIEPMVNVGTGDVKTAKDEWTILTYDGQKSAHFEHTILITKGKPEIITG